MMLSSKVVFPWSTWAMIAMFLNFNSIMRPLIHAVFLKASEFYVIFSAVRGTAETNE